MSESYCTVVPLLRCFQGRKSASCLSLIVPVYGAVRHAGVRGRGGLRHPGGGLADRAAVRRRRGRGERVGAAEDLHVARPLRQRRRAALAAEPQGEELGAP